MDCKINWTIKAWQSFESNIFYLENYWSEKEVITFVNAVDRKIEILKKFPRIGLSKNFKHRNLRYTTIHKKVQLVYKHKPLKNEIDLLLFWNTLQNPVNFKAQ